MKAEGERIVERLASSANIVVNTIHLGKEATVWPQPAGRVGLCVCTMSKAWLGGDGWTFSLKQGMACLLPAGQELSAQGENSRLILAEAAAGFFLRKYMMVLEEFPIFRKATMACQEGTQREPEVFWIDQPELLEYMLEDMQYEYREKQPGYQISLQSSLAQILVVLARSAGREDGRTEEDRLTLEILQYLSENVERATLKDTAARFYYHPNTINRLLLRKTGKNFSETIQGLRMSYIRQLLVETELPVREAAELCGYRNMTHFYQVFYRSFGMTPLEYRRENRV